MGELVGHLLAILDVRLGRLASHWEGRWHADGHDVELRPTPKLLRWQGRTHVPSVCVCVSARGASGFSSRMAGRSSREDGLDGMVRSGGSLKWRTFLHHQLLCERIQLVLTLRGGEPVPHGVHRAELQG